MFIIPPFQHKPVEKQIFSPLLFSSIHLWKTSPLPVFFTTLSPPYLSHPWKTFLRPQFAKTPPNHSNNRTSLPHSFYLYLPSSTPKTRTLQSTPPFQNPNTTTPKTTPLASKPEHSRPQHQSSPQNPNTDYPALHYITPASIFHIPKPQ